MPYEIARDRTLLTSPRIIRIICHIFTLLYTHPYFRTTGEKETVISPVVAPVVAPDPRLAELRTLAAQLGYSCDRLEGFEKEFAESVAMKMDSRKGDNI